MREGDIGRRRRRPAAFQIRLQFDRPTMAAPSEERIEEAYRRRLPVSARTCGDRLHHPREAQGEVFLRLALGRCVLLALALLGCGGSALEISNDAGSSRDAEVGGDAALPDRSSSGDAGGGDAGRADTSAATRPDGTCIANAYRRDGACMCSDTTPSVCGDACVDLRNDDQNCGACGQACLTSSVCVAGQCGAQAVVVQPGRAGSCEGMDLAVSDGSLFWADQAAGKILRAPVTGGAPAIIAEGEDAPSAIIVRGSTAYWLTGAPSLQQVAALLRAAPIAGGAATTVVSPADGLGGFTLSADGQTIYFSTSTTVSKVSASVSDGAPVVVAQLGIQLPRGLAVDGEYIVIATVYNGHIESVHLVDGVEARCESFDATGNPTNIMCTYIGKQVEAPPVVVTSAGRAFWPAEDAIGVNDVAPTGLSFQSIGANAGFSSISAIAVSGQTLFYADLGWANQGTIGELMLPPGDLTLTSDATPIRLARGQHAPQSVAADATRVYWSTSDCAILAHDR
jgi:hypothetical protein